MSEFLKHEILFKKKSVMEFGREWNLFSEKSFGDEYWI